MVRETDSWRHTIIVLGVSESMRDLVKHWTVERDGERRCCRCGEAVVDEPSALAAHLLSCQGFQGETYEFLLFSRHGEFPLEDRLNQYGADGWAVVASLVAPIEVGLGLGSFPPGATFTKELVLQRPRRKRILR